MPAWKSSLGECEHKHELWLAQEVDLSHRFVSICAGSLPSPVVPAAGCDVGLWLWKLIRQYTPFPQASAPLLWLLRVDGRASPAF